jgi:hypothetical protein
MNKKILRIGIALVAMVTHLEAQTAIINNGQITFGGITFQVPAIVNTPITINGQTLLITTNASGGYTVSTSGPAGTNSFTPPTTMADAVAFAKSAVENNNPANISYYSTNGEWDLSVGGVFAQNSGQAAAQLSIERYGLIKAWPQFALGSAVLEGNQAGQNGTAAAYGFIDYRHPIGDVAFSFGVGGGYDNYTSKPMGIAKIEVEYRQNRHLGEFVGVGYDFEGFGNTKTAVGTTISNPSGLIIGGGIRYAF